MIMSKTQGSIPMKSVSDYHAKDRWFNTAKVLLTIAPLIMLGYLQLGNGAMNPQELLRQDPTLAVSLMASMTGPFIAYLLGFSQKHMYEGDAAHMMTNLTLMMVAEAMLYNTMYFIMMIVLMYFVHSMTGVSPMAAFRQKWKNHLFRDISGSIVLIVFSAFCMFVSIRLGMR